MGKRARKRKRHDVSRDQFLPGVAAGLTFGDEMTPQEALQEHYKPMPDGQQVVSHMKNADLKLQRGVPFAPFVASNSTDAVFSDGVTDRPQMSYDAVYTKAGMRLLREGRQCLRCQEPQPVPFPGACDMCGYPMKDRQIMDIAVEFEGDRHLGPAKPVAQYLEEIELRKEKRKFIKKVMGGGQGKIPASWLHDATLLGGSN